MLAELVTLLANLFLIFNWFIFIAEMQAKPSTNGEVDKKKSIQNACE